VTDFTLDTTPLAIPFQNAVARLEQVAFAEALWTRRLDIWSTDPVVRQKIADRLGWLSALEFVTPELPRVRAFAERIRAEGFTDVVLLGMGGSSLAPEVLRQVVGVAPGWPRFRVLDSVDPDAVRDVMAAAASTLFVMASKSGSTIEPNAMAAEAQRRVRAAGMAHWGPRFVAITDEGTPFHHRARAEGFREIFVNPSDIGGRFSALSFFGLVPAALMGADLDALLKSAAAMADACRIPNPAANPGLVLGAFMAAGAQMGRDKLTLLFPDALASLGLWIEQLVAESTGKQGKGIVPLAGEPREASFGGDRLVVAVTLAAESPRDVERAAIAGTPIMHVAMEGPLALGAEFLRWEVATAAAGLLLDINPFDEPNVQQAKDATRTLLDIHAAQKRLPTPEPHAALEHARLTLSSAAEEGLGGADPTRFLSLVGGGDYVGLLAYLPPDDSALGAALARVRAEIAADRACPTMFGYGPRYLHSTGQLHKGGPNNGVFIIITAEVAEDLAVPNEPFSFGVLEMAQALGDFQSLDRTGRRALHIHLPRRDARLLERVVTMLT
jgi:glucose-6-phosphate isomerase